MNDLFDPLPVGILPGIVCFQRLRFHKLPGAQVGDLVLVHAGFAIEKVRVEDAAELEALWDEIREGAGDAGQLPF